MATGFGKNKLIFYECMVNQRKDYQEVLRVSSETEDVAQAAAQYIGELARRSIDARGQFTVALSGGRTPWRMLQLLAEQEHNWNQWQVFQVDERVAPENDESRNLVHIQRNFFDRAGIQSTRLHAMDVEAGDLSAAAERYQGELQAHCGDPAVLDLVVLGMGSDGHMASLVPDDPVLEVDHTDVAITGEYQGQKRMTLTLPIINRACQVVWLITGSEKTQALRKMLDQDRSIPAARVDQEHAVVFADEAAAVTI